MNTQRLGCLSPLALVSVVIAFVILAVAEMISGDSMFSPGALNAQAGHELGGVTSHADIGKDCTACHAPFWSGDTLADRCLACHTAVRDELSDPSSLHGIVSAEASRTCRGCHTEHNGPTAALTVVDKLVFPHQLTGFSLAAHQARSDGAPFACADCHTQGIARFEVQVCSACHGETDPGFTAGHISDYGEDCLACHDGFDRLVGFDHSRVKFALTGAHQGLDCAGCHAGARSAADLQSLPSACKDCHLAQDAHQGTLGTNCGVCHDPQGWKPAAFNHDLAAFKLVGRHTAVECQQCHASGYQGTPQDCASCHQQDDHHQGRFGTDCAACHTPEGWEPASFDHNLAAFKLVGKHTAVECQQCHASGYQGTPQDCISCHQKDDSHKGRFGTDCAACHTAQGWKPASYDHNRAAFKLVGKHTAVACQQCHTQTLKGTPQDCVSCHKPDDPHSGRFGTDCAACHTAQGWKPASFDHNRAAFKLVGKHTSVPCQQCHTQTLKGTPQACVSCHQKEDAHNGRFGTDCATCHTAQGWKPASFDHNRAAFKLVGRHTAVACQQCHTQSLKGTPQDCVSCHRKDDAHSGRFGTDCATCHTAQAWKPASYDHNRAAFKLVGRHTSVACQQCHTQSLKGTPQDCYSCHKQDDYHQGRFGTDCAACHTAQAWKPASFDHNRAAFKLDGAHVRVDCLACHVNQVFKGTPQDCYSCHKQDDHHEGRFGTDCAACHTTSSWQGATFDHNRAAFKLTGAHVQVDCAACHINQVYKGTPQDCYSCHRQDDHHEGRFGTDCAACHTTSGWQGATFDHNLAAFKLDGAHVRVDCAACHVNQVYKGTPTNCAACHADPAFHAGMFSGQACSQCHTTAAWRPASYNGPHTFPMNHGEKNNSCADCHQPNLASWTCYTCHNQAEIEKKHREKGFENFSDCLRCHPTGRKEDGD